MLGVKVGVLSVVGVWLVGSVREMCFFWFSISCLMMLRFGVFLEVNWADGGLSGLSLFHGGDRLAWVNAGVDRLTVAKLHMYPRRIRYIGQARCWGAWLVARRLWRAIVGDLLLG